ncbi:Uncharacterised protein [Vibrio cholerae]|nr:Uncharacterised protein [Vibrio cholerae]
MVIPARVDHQSFTFYLCHFEAGCQNGLICLALRIHVQSWEITQVIVVGPRIAVFSRVLRIIMPTRSAT